MDKFKKTLALADKFELKLSVAQAATSAQAADVETALKTANVFDVSDKVAPLLNDAKVPGDAKVAVSIVVDSHLNPTYVVKLDPANPAASAKLGQLIKGKFSAAMKKALVDAKLNVADKVQADWVHFD